MSMDEAPVTIDSGVTVQIEPMLLRKAEAARVLGVSPRTAARLWTYARAALYRDLSDRPGDVSP